jgi:mRNA interferase RelE/StbE
MTGCYRVVIKRSAERELRAIPVPDLPRVVARVQGLANRPRPSGCETLCGQDRYRIRQGDYRIVYAVSDKERLVEIIRIGHRREVYRT